MSLPCTFAVEFDGARSGIRAALGITLEGTTYPERWLIVDVADTKDRYRNTRVICDPRHPAITLPAPAGTRRFEFKLRQDEASDMPSDEVVRDLMAGAGPDREAPITRKTVSTFHARVAPTGRSGRIFQASDAAHLSTPFAGQGMNSGMRDALNLAWKLSSVIQGRLGPGLLGSYEVERIPHARALIDMAVRMGRIIMPRTVIGAFVTRSLMRLSGIYPPAPDYISQMKYKPQPRFPAGFFVPDGLGRYRTRARRLFPQPRVERADGIVVALDTLLGNGFALVAMDHDPVRAAALANAGGRLTDVAVICVLPRDTAFPVSEENVTIVRDVDGAIASYFGLHAKAAVLRPDRYVALILTSLHPDGIRPFDDLCAATAAIMTDPGCAVGSVSP